MNGVLENLITYNIPEMFPIPKHIFNNMNLCLASWGSAYTAAEACKRTIMLIDDISLVPQGVCGITIKNKDYLKKVPVDNSSLEELVDEIIYGNNYKDIEYERPSIAYELGVGQEEVDNRMRPFVERNYGHKYYNILNIYKGDLRISVERGFYMILGFSNTRRIVNLYKKIWLRGGNL